MKTLFTSLALLFLAFSLASSAAFADTYPLMLVYNTNGVTGKAAQVRVVVTDAAGTVLVTSTNNPSGSAAFAESAVIPGEYFAPITLTDAPANLPVRAEFTTADASAGAAPAVYLTERAAEVTAGYTAALPGTLTTGATNTSTLLLALATYQSALTTGSTTTALNTALTGTADLTGGKVVFTTGVNKGVARTIAAMNSTTGAITLLTGVPNTPGATDAFSVVQGSKALEQFLAGLGTDSRPVLSANAQPAVSITNALPALDGSNRVLLQPVQTGVTIPTVTALTNPVVASSVTGAVGSVTAPVVASSVTGAVGSVTGAVGSVTASVVASSVTGSVGSISGITFPSNFGTFSVDTSGRVTLVPGQSTTASNMVAAAPTVAQITAALPSDTSMATDTQTALTAQGLTVARAAKLDNADVATSTRSTFAGGAVASVTGAVTLPTTAPAGYGGAGGAGDTSGVTTLLTRIPGTVQPQTGDAFAAATAAPAATATALMTKPITGTGLTLGQEFVLLGLASVKVASIANTWNSTTHILTTAYSTTGGVVVLTTSAQYPATQVLSPALSGVSAAVGTVPQP